MDKTTNILIVGVGGQGTLLASKIICRAAQLSGFDVKQSEIHGMAQRGGSVVSHVKFGARVHSSLVEKGQADLIISFEKLEALRWVSYLKPTGKIIVNDTEISPITVISGAAAYPNDIYEKLKELGTKTIIIDAKSIAQKAGELRTQNVALLGAAAKLLAIEPAIWQQAIAELVPAKAKDKNLAAFNRGLE